MISSIPQRFWWSAVGAVGLFALACGSADTTGAAPADSVGAADADDASEPGDTSGSNDTGESPQVCVLPSGAAPDSADDLGCEADYFLLASPPIVASIPGVRSVKTVLDLADDGHLHFQNSQKYRVHWEFARAHLSGKGLPIVPDLSMFNQTEYYSPDRRFILGAVTYYEGPKAWTYEIAPYDTASIDQIVMGFRAAQAHGFFGEKLAFHPTSTAVEALAKQLPADIPVITTDTLFEGIDYQPLNLAESLGRLRFVKAAELATTYLDFRDIVVLDHIPNDISVVVGTITADLQTPLAHINVLAENRGTPNMGLRGAMENPVLRALEGQWVRLKVGAQTWSVEAVERAVADAWWESHRPPAVQVPSLDISLTGLPNLDTLVTIPTDTAALKDAIRKVIPAVGGKAAHYAALVHIPKDVTVRAGFAVPVAYYADFMSKNGFATRVAALLADPAFNDDPKTRDEALATLRTDMMAAPLDPDFEALLLAKIAADFPNTRMRFRSSTNAEDLEGFTGAGLYISKSGDPNDPTDTVADAVREVWSSVWFFRAFEERRYRGIDHTKVAMALLVHPTFIDEAATGVALTANPFDPTGIEPGFYVNVQAGDASVVLPNAGETTDQLIYQYDQPGQPVSYYGHSSLIPAGETVLSRSELEQLGRSLSAIHRFFAPAYGTAPGVFYSMDVEFKLMPKPDGTREIVIKQARPHPGRGTDPEGE